MPKTLISIRSVLAALVWGAVLPTAALAQSQIAGRVSDNTGAVLPGVTVEAASPVLIEGSRTAVTDGVGRYAIIDLRPGTYTVTFSLPGFVTIVRDQLSLPADFTLTVNVEMRLGGIEETITVSGESPIVDVQQASRTQVLSREVIDSLPAGRAFQARVALIPGVQANLDIGGSRSMDQHNLRVAGMEDNEVTVVVDGMLLNSNSSDGASQYYFNDAMSQEMSVQTSGVDAETSAGGVRVNMVPREGGNTLSATFYAEGMNKDMTSSNLTDRLRAEGVTQVTGLHRAFDINGSAGGPIQRERLWWFYTGHRRAVDQVVLGSFYPDGSPGIDDTLIYANQLRLTWQANARNKIAAFYDRNNKIDFHAFSAGEDIATVSQTRGVGKYGPRYAAQVKWTSTLSSRFLFEAGWGSNRVDYDNKPQPGLRQDRPTTVRTCVVTPCLAFDANQVGPNIHPWYTTLSRFDPEALIERWGNATDDFGKVPQRYIVSAKLSYVTGSHNVKVGVQNSFGPENWTRINNGDVRSQEYRAGVPESVVVWNTPLVSSVRVKYDLGVFAQDSWTIDRLTLSPGVRFEWFNSQVDDQASAAGRFVAARHVDEIPNVPDWFDVSPRLGVAYDLFGDAKTAVKFHVGKYVHNLTHFYATRYNPIAATTDRRDWFDCYMDLGGRRCSGANPYGTNSDNIVQDWEIGPSGVSNFGARRVNRPDPDLKRDYYIRTSLGVDHQLLPWLGVTAAWNTTKYTNLLTTTNVLRSLADYEVFQIANPLEGYQDQRVTLYNLKLAKLGAVDNVDTNATDQREQLYNGYMVGWNARLPRGGNVFGGVTVESFTSVTCDSPFDPNTFRFCDTTGGDGEIEALAKVPNAGPASGVRPTLPYLTEFKIAGDHPLPYGVQVAAAFRSLPGAERLITWSVPTSAFRAAGLSRTQAVTVRLNPPGSLYYDRVNVLDFNLAKSFDLPGGLRWKVGANIYNILNPDTILTRTNTFGATLHTPRSVILARFWKVHTLIEW